jgi:hypothetical protein
MIARYGWRFPLQSTENSRTTPSITTTRSQPSCSSSAAWTMAKASPPLPAVKTACGVSFSG